MNHPAYIEFIKNRKPANGLFVAVWQKLRHKGQLYGLSGDQIAEKVLDTAEQVIEDFENSTYRRKR